MFPGNWLPSLISPLWLLVGFSVYRELPTPGITSQFSEETDATSHQSDILPPATAVTTRVNRRVSVGSLASQSVGASQLAAGINKPW